MRTYDYYLSKGQRELGISGWRDGLLTAILQNYDGYRSSIARRGFMSCLYLLRSMIRPASFDRSPDTRALQAIIEYAIALIENTPHGSTYA